MLYDSTGILDCKDGSILKPVMSRKKGQREKYFYKLVNGNYNENPYFRKELYTLDTIRQLSNFTPTFRGMISLPEHPDGEFSRSVIFLVGLAPAMSSSVSWHETG